MKRSLVDIYKKQQELLNAYRMAREHRESLYHQQVPQSVRSNAVDNETRAYEEWWIGSQIARITISKITD